MPPPLSSLIRFFVSSVRAFSCRSAEIPMKCIYSKKENDEQFEEFGTNAAHYTLPPHTYVDVRYFKKTIPLQINDRPLKSPYSNNVLELSLSAAKKLGIEDPGAVDCYIRIPFWQNHPMLQQIAFFLPVGAFIGLLIIYNNLDLYM